MSQTIVSASGMNNRGGAWHAEWQAGPHSFICLCKLACPGPVSHVIVPMRANRCGIQPQSRLAAPSVHYFILFYFKHDAIQGSAPNTIVEGQRDSRARLILWAQLSRCLCIQRSSISMMVLIAGSVKLGNNGFWPSMSRLFCFALPTKRTRYQSAARHKL